MTPSSYNAPSSNNVTNQEREINLHGDEDATGLTIEDLAAKAVASAPSHSSTDVEDDEESGRDSQFAFRNDIQRCEAFIATLQACLEVYKKHDRIHAVNIMANKLEKVVDALNGVS